MHRVSRGRNDSEWFYAFLSKTAPLGASHHQAIIIQVQLERAQLAGPCPQAASALPELPHIIRYENHVPLNT